MPKVKEKKIPMQATKVDWKLAPTLSDLKDTSDGFKTGAPIARIPHTNLFVQPQSGRLNLININTRKVVKTIKDDCILGNENLIVLNSDLIATRNYSRTIKFWSTKKAEFITEIELDKNEIYLTHDTHRIYLENIMDGTIVYLGTTSNLNERHPVSEAESLKYKILDENNSCITPSGNIFYLTEDHELVKFSNGEEQIVYTFPYAKLIKDRELLNANDFRKDEQIDDNSNWHSALRKYMKNQYSRNVPTPRYDIEIIICDKLCALDDDHVLLAGYNKTIERGRVYLYSPNSEKLIYLEELYDNFNLTASPTGMVIIQFENRNAYDTVGRVLSFQTESKDEDVLVQSPTAAA